MKVCSADKQASKKELGRINHNSSELNRGKPEGGGAVRNLEGRGSMSGGPRTPARGRGAPTRWPPAAPGPASSRGTAARAPACTAPSAPAPQARTSCPSRRSLRLLPGRRPPLPVLPRTLPLNQGFNSAVDTRRVRYDKNSAQSTLGQRETKTEIPVRADVDAAAALARVDVDGAAAPTRRPAGEGAARAGGAGSRGRGGVGGTRIQ